MRGVLAGIGAAFVAGAAAGQSPSFDCAKAQGEVEILICGSPELAQLDAELARLFALAHGGYIKAAKRDELVAGQGDWVTARGECLTAADPAACIRDGYVIRIATLVRDFPDTRNGKGISVGPFATKCDGLGSEMTAVFVNSDPGAVFLAWDDRTAVLGHAISGSGARYEATRADGSYLFWNKGNEATFEAPGVNGTVNCTLTEAW